MTASLERANGVVFSERLADDSEFPPPVVRGVMAPHYADIARLLLPPASDWAPVLRRSRFTAWGRNALALIAAALDLGPGCRVLLPSYHCPSMVEPFVAAGAEVVFYPVERTLRPLQASFEAALAEGADAVVFVRYFGFDTLDPELVRACERGGASVIQDCAHAFFALPQVPENHCAVASSTKFFPVVDGGVALLPENTSFSAQLAARGLGEEIRAMLELLDRAWRTRALLPFSALAALLSQLRQCFAATRAVAEDPQPLVSPDGYRYYHPETRDLAPLRSSRALVSRARFDVVATRRRANYRHWIDALDDIAGIDALFPELRTDEVPYVVPAVVAGGDSAFRAIRHNGVPLYRWEELAAAGCPVADGFRDSLIQLPCHQDLLAEDIAQLAGHVGVALQGLAA